MLMDIFSISRYSSFIFLLVFSFVVTRSAKPVSSFSFNAFHKNPNFNSEIAVFGDVEIGDSFVRITRPSPSRGPGRIMYRKPIQFVEGNPRKSVSFSTYFSFSISPGDGDGLAFVVLPHGFPFECNEGGSFGLLPGLERASGVLAVEFDTSMDEKYRDPNGNHVGIDVDSLVSAKTSDVSSINLVLNSGEKLHCWIDYNANLKKLEVRLSNSGANMPYNPLISYSVDLSEMWKEDMFVGISSFNGNSTQTSSVYSWSFRLKHNPNWLHSEPVDPRAFSERSKRPSDHRKSDYVSRILTSLMFGIGCGAMTAFLVLFAWSVIVKRRPQAPQVHPVELGYEKIKVGTEKASDSGKK
eukprot:TRINITY_DN8972_c0_g1_i1.p1 TRINITY_DN8972_c0_g1~~TRINITY_DN8972_c0_g1_i1.p1  ORF type:complete len:354 (-),score=40.70 TRINITY_DN8972_c0_g1_i1:167-1228(-)